jgi:RNA recognition motif-containing protein
MKLHVSNLPEGTSDSDLADLFRPFGAVTSARVTVSTFSGHSQGFGLVEMLRECGERAMSELDGQQIDCMVLRVNEAEGKGMTTFAHPGSIAFLCLVALQLFLGIPGHALAQAAADKVPENAVANSYGSGWLRANEHRMTDPLAQAATLLSSVPGV